MPSTFICPLCEAKLLVDSVTETPQVRCPKCAAVVSVGASSKVQPPKHRTSRTMLESPRQIPPSTTNSIPKSAPSESVPTVSMSIVGRVFVGLTVVFSLLAAVAALLSVGGDLLGPIIAGLAILMAFLAVGFELATAKSLASLGASATAMFLGMAVLLFCLGSPAMEKKIKEYRETMAKAEEVEAKQADALRQLASANDQLAKAEEESRKAAQDLRQVENKLAKLKKESQDIEPARAQLKNERLAAEKASAKAKEDESRAKEKQDEADRRFQDAMDLKNKADSKIAQASEDVNKAKELLAEAKVEKDKVNTERKIVDDAIASIKSKLRSQAPIERKDAIQKLRRIGPLAARYQADFYLCEVVANDSVLAKDALDALSTVNPTLYKQVSNFSLMFDQKNYVQAIGSLPELGRAGIPFIVKQLNASDGAVEKLKATDVRDLLFACRDALVAIAPKDELAVQQLVILPVSKLVNIYRREKVAGVNSSCEFRLDRIKGMASGTSQHPRNEQGNATQASG